MARRPAPFLVAAALISLSSTSTIPAIAQNGGKSIRASAEVYERRMADWRLRQIVYQVFVDRFDIGMSGPEKAKLYEAPRRLRAWTDQPTKGEYVKDAEIWRHEIDFWGGDLPGVTKRLGYIKALGCNVVYLNPIFLAYSNHKYDATDFFAIDPQYGTAADFERLCDEAHRLGMRVILDGVFNHTGRRNVWFQDAVRNQQSPYREYYTFGAGIKNGYLAWIDIPNLPELRYESPIVRQRVYRDADSIVQKWLKYADGWRLDVAFELGPEVLTELTSAAHAARHDSYTVGENYNYPADWFPSLDGVMNMYLSRIIFLLAEGKMEGPKAGDMIDVMIQDAGIEPILRSWIVLSNHDRSRLASSLPSMRDREFAIRLMVTLPGAPLVYYGEELGLTGKEDPEQRGPMDWKRAEAGDSPEFAMIRRALALRNSKRALQVGDFVRIPTSKLLGFARVTSSVRDTVVVLANPTDEPVTEIITPRDGWLQDTAQLRDIDGGDTFEVGSGIATVTVPPRTVRVLSPVIPPDGPNYTRYKRVP